MAYTIEFTAAQSGSGKTYRRGPHFLCTEWIPNNRGIHYSNFPLKPDKIADECVKRHNVLSIFKRLGWKGFKPITHQQVVDRIHVIPSEVMKMWRLRQSGPWEYFKDKDIAGAHIAIDECHLYITNEDKEEWLTNWKEWIGALRHHKVSALEFVSQYETKVSTKIRHEAHLKREFFNSEKRTDPFFGIVMSDWYEMRAKFITGEYISTVWEEEFIKYKGKDHLQRSTKFEFQQLYFDMYDSYNKVVTDENGLDKTEGEVYHPFKDHTHFGMIIWFLRKHFISIFFRFCIVGLACWLLFFGGITMMMNKFLGFMKSSAMHKNLAVQTTSSANVASLNSSDNTTNNHNLPAAVPAAPNIPGKQSQTDETAKKMADLQTQLDAAKKQLQDLRDEGLKSHEFVLLDSSGVILRDGTSLLVGDTIQGGPWNGTTILGINLQRRSILLSDGSLVHLSSQ